MSSSEIESIYDLGTDGVAGWPQQANGKTSWSGAYLPSLRFMLVARLLGHTASGSSQYGRGRARSTS
jgi:hypothetical protein